MKVTMTGPNFDGPYSICKATLQEDADGVDFTTLRWGYSTEERAISALKEVSASENVPLNELAVVTATFAIDLGIE